MLESDRIDVSEGSYVYKTNSLHKCVICQSLVRYKREL